MKSTMKIKVEHAVLLAGLVMALPLSANDQGVESSAFPPENFNVEKSSKPSMAISPSIKPTQQAIRQTTNPWGMPSARPSQQPAPMMRAPMPTNRMPIRNSGSMYQRPMQYGYPQQYPRNAVAPRQAPPSLPPRQMGYQTPTGSFSNMFPFGNSFSPNSFMNNGAMPTPWSNVGGINPWKNNNNSSMPFFPQAKNTTGKKNAWGDVRHIWPDFYTEFTDEVWDKSVNAPYDMGRMPGGWRAPSLSSPDPVTVGDAVTNQFPPILEEMGNMMDFAN